MGEEGSELFVCVSCGQRIYDGQYFQVLNVDWYVDCFRCCDCSVFLLYQYYEKDGQFFCKKDYWVCYGEFCYGCFE